MATIRIVELGNHLGTRAHGKVARKMIEDLLAKNLDEKIIIDFEGVKMTDHSFIDESIGKLITKYGLDFIKSKIALRNSNKFVTMILKVVIRGRSRDLKAA